MGLFQSKEQVSCLRTPVELKFITSPLGVLTKLLYIMQIFFDTFSFMEYLFLSS